MGWRTEVVVVVVITARRAQLDSDDITNIYAMLCSTVCGSGPPLRRAPAGLSDVLLGD